MSKDDIIAGAVFASILITGGTVCFFGFLKLSKPVTWGIPFSGSNTVLENNSNTHSDDSEPTENSLSSTDDYFTDTESDLYTGNSDDMYISPADIYAEINAKDERAAAADSFNSNEIKHTPVELFDYFGKDVRKLENDIGPYNDDIEYAITCGAPVTYDGIEIIVDHETGEIKKLTMTRVNAGDSLLGIKINVPYEEADKILTDRYKAKKITDVADSPYQTYSFKENGKEIYVTVDKQGNNVGIINEVTVESEDVAHY